MPWIDLRDFASGVVGAAVLALSQLTIGRPFRRVLRRLEPTVGGLDLAFVVETDPAKMPHGELDYATSFYFPRGFAPPEGPWAVTDWWSWAHASGGIDVRRTKVLVTLQGVEDCAILVGEPRLSARPIALDPGVICLPEGLGGGGVSPRVYDVKLEVGRAPRVTYSDPAGRPSQFTLSKGETELIVLLVSAESGNHSWTAEVPLTINGVGRTIEITDRGGPFVTIGDFRRSERLMWADDQWHQLGAS